MSGDELVEEIHKALDRTHKNGEWQTRQAVLAVLHKYEDD